LQTKNNNIKRFFALLGVLLLLLPITYQSYHELTEHHEHFICKAKSNHHLHQYLKKCPIESFKYSSFINTITLQAYQNTLKLSGIIFLHYNYKFVNPFLQNIKLRAPPLNI